jgi:hypothetical protein
MKRAIASHAQALLAAIALLGISPAWAQWGSASLLTAPPSAAGEAVQLSVSVRSDPDIGFLPPPLYGTASFTRGTGEPLPGCTGLELNNSIASCTVIGEAPGPHTYRATFSGNPFYTGSVSNLLEHLITGAGTAGFSVSANPVHGVPGQPFLINVSVSAPAGQPTGTISLSSPAYLNFQAQQFADVPGCVNIPLINGQAQCTTSRELAGRHVYRVTYSGDAAYRVSVTGLLFPVGNAPHRFDLSGDGRSDVVWYHTGYYGMRSMLGAISVLDSPIPLDVLSSSDWQVAGIADLNGDTLSDVITRNTATGEVSVQLVNNLWNPPKTTIYAEPNLDWKIEQFVDLDDDGRAEIIWRNQTSGEVYAMRTNGTAVESGQTIYSEPDLNWKIVASGDLNGDGKGDLLWRNTATGDVFVMLMDGYNVIGGGVIYSEPNPDWTIVGMGDFNRDGRADILWRNMVTGDVFQMQMNGAVVTAGQVIYTEPDMQWKIAGLGDYNGDGRADIVWRHSVTGQVFLMLMNGFTIQSGSVIYTETDPQWQIIGP